MRAGSQPMLAIGFMVGSSFVNTIMLSCVKELAGELHPFEIAFFRSMFGFLVLLPFVWRAGGIGTLRTKEPKLHILRSALNAGGMLLFFLSLSLAPLATVSAIGFAAPLFAALFAILFLGEKVGIRRWTGLMIGFIGTVIILRPGAGVIDTGALVALASSLLWAGAMVVIKRLTGTDSPLAITTWAALGVGVFCFPAALLVWKWPTPEQWAWLLVIGALGSIIQYTLARAFELADTTVVLPFDFLKLVWASLFGFIIFAEIPDPWAWLGGTIIFCSAIYIAFRERAATHSD